MSRRRDGSGAGELAVIADVHGNRWALEAVLEDIARTGAQAVLNLGDSLYGPLDPAGTAELLRDAAAVNVRGNQDRILLDPPASAPGNVTYRFVAERLRRGHLEWLRGHEIGPVRFGPLILCHGTPERDDRYLLERISATSVTIEESHVLAEELAAVDAEVILCGHSHVPRVVFLPDRRLVVNPGSVGLPAYTDDDPFPHAMEAGSPHARYARLERTDTGWTIEHVALAYDWSSAADAARRNGRPDWAQWLRSGRAGPH